MIWRHLGYANEGQISFCFLSQELLVQLSPNFVCIWSVTKQPNRIIRWNWYKAVLVMQMKVKGQISFCFVSQKPLVRLSPNFVCILECQQTIILHNKIKLIWGHLGYANEGQRSNLILFCISETVSPIEPKFWYVVAETILYKTNYINLSIFWLTSS